MLFFEAATKDVFNVESVALSKHVTHYGPLSGFPYYNMTTSDWVSEWVIIVQQFFSYIMARTS
jgi:hypothetical protein